MTKERINEIIDLSKNNAGVKEAFKVLDEVSDFLQKNKKFFNFASKQAKSNYVSPTLMFLLCYDFLNETGKYKEWLEKQEKESKKQKSDSKPNKTDTKSEKKAVESTKVDIKNKETKLDIFDLGL